MRACKLNFLNIFASATENWEKSRSFKYGYCVKEKKRKGGMNFTPTPTGPYRVKMASCITRQKLYGQITLEPNVFRTLDLVSKWLKQPLMIDFFGRSVKNVLYTKMSLFNFSNRIKACIILLHPSIGEDCYLSSGVLTLDIN